MNTGSTLFLRAVIYLIGLAVAALCFIGVPYVIIYQPVGMYLPILIGMELTAVPFFYGLFQVLNLLAYIDQNTAFSDVSVFAIKKIKNSAFLISALYALGMPFIYYVADKDDSPGVLAIGLFIMSAFFVAGVFAAVLQKLLQTAIDIKSENDLTV